MSAQKKVLIIDGEGDGLALCDAFRKKSASLINVSVVHSSDAGIMKSTQWKPDLVVLEIMIPGFGNGFYVLRRLKMEIKTKNIPVIVYTKLDGEEKSAIDEGALDYFVKPDIAPERVVEKVIQYLNLNTSP